MHSHMFRGKRWVIKRKSIKKRTKFAGTCERPTTPNKTIVLDKDLKEDALLETAIHEALHACLWDLDEETVEDVGRDIARFLRRLNFRLIAGGQ